MKLSSGDQIILGAAESEVIAVEKKEFVLYLNRTCKDLESSRIFPFDAREADKIDHSCTHYVIDTATQISLEVIYALSLGILLVQRSFVQALCHGVLNEQPANDDLDLHMNEEIVKRFDMLKIGYDIFKAVNIMDPSLDEITEHYLRLLGASFSKTPKESLKNIVLGDRLDFLIVAVVKGNLNLLDELVPKLEVPSGSVNPQKSTMSIIVPESPGRNRAQMEVEDSIFTVVKSKPRQIVKRRSMGNSDVMMVSTFVDLYRPTKTTAGSNVGHGTNFKKFKKSMPGDRKAFECIGLADMKPYKGVMETGGVNQSKSEVWLEPDDSIATPRTAMAKRVKLDQPVGSASVEPPKFKSAFFNEGLQFE